MRDDDFMAGLVVFLLAEESHGVSAEILNFADFVAGAVFGEVRG